MREAIILASGSPRRKALLREMGVAFTVLTRPTDETTALPAREAVAVLAQRKAQAVADTLREGLVLGADTLVALDGHALGKPVDCAQAAQMLAQLSGRTHAVYTGVCLIDAASGARDVRVCETKVAFRALSPDEISAYVLTKEPMDKAGAYAIQGGAGKFVDHIEGPFDNVMGLPTQMVKEMLDGAREERGAAIE
ncbi:MAG: Maf family protein [Clostridia bacterium]